jgi:hypothetical protein
MKTTIIRLAWVLVLFILLSSSLFGQQFGIGFLFRPLVELGTEWVAPASMGDEGKLTMYRQHLHSTLPLGGKLKFDLKELSLGGSFQFLTLNAGLRSLSADFLPPNTHLGNLSLGITGIQTALFKGTYVYQVQIGMVEDLRQRQTFRPFGVASLMRLKIKGLYKHNLYGMGLFYQNNRLLPMPLWGVNRKLAKKLTAQVLLPLEATLSYKVSKKTSLHWQNSLHAFRSGITNFVPDTLTAPYLDYRHLRTGLVFRKKVGKGAFLEMDTGMALFRQILIANDEKLLRAGAPYSPYVALKIRKNLGKGLLGSYLFGSDI